MSTKVLAPGGVSALAMSPAEASASDGAQKVSANARGNTSITNNPQIESALGASGLMLYDSACRALAAAVSVDEVKNIRDKAMAMQVYAKQAKDRSLIENATELRMRAERRAGELLAEMEKNKGAVPGKTGRKGKPALDPTPKLSDLGVTKTQSSRWQRFAALDDEAFESRVIAARKKALSGLDTVHREVKQRAERAVYESRIQQGCTIDDLRALAASGYKAGSIYVDVPTRYLTYSGEGKQRSAERYYNTQGIGELKAMAPLIQALAAKDCALHYWTSGPQNANAIEIIREWGFDFTTWGFIWIKTEPGVEIVKLDGKGLHFGMGFTTGLMPRWCCSRSVANRYGLTTTSVRSSSRRRWSIRPSRKRCDGASNDSIPARTWSYTAASRFPAGLCGAMRSRASNPSRGSHVGRRHDRHHRTRDRPCSRRSARTAPRRRLIFDSVPRPLARQGPRRLLAELAHRRRANAVAGALLRGLRCA
jgi:N6-adenosine-specific RNA methylase IME4